jgi:hypothetical protein
MPPIPIHLSMATSPQYQSVFNAALTGAFAPGLRSMTLHENWGGVWKVMIMLARSDL